MEDVKEKISTIFSEKQRTVSMGDIHGSELNKLSIDPNKGNHGKWLEEGC